MASILNDLAQDVAALLPRCPVPAIEQALAAGYRDLCRRAYVWSAEIYFDRTAEHRKYTVPQKFTAEVVQCDGLFIRTAQDVDEERIGRLVAISDYRLFIEGGKLKIELQQESTDTQANGYAVRLVLSPGRNSDKVDAPEVFKEYAEAIKGYAIHQLASRRNRPWSDKDLAVEQRKEFNRGIGRGLNRRITRYGQGTGVVTLG